jgi:hypothetical protein
MGSPYPTLSLSLKQTSVFPLRPWYTVAQLSSVIKEEDPTVRSVGLVHIPETPDQPPHKWANSATMEDVLRAGFQVKSRLAAGSQEQPNLVSTPGFYIEIDGKRFHVDMPTFEGTYLLALMPVV